LVLLYLCSCSSRDNLSYPEFSLKGKSVGSSDFFAEPTSILSDGGLFIVADRKTKENFHLLDENFYPIRSFGTIGNGPSEISLRVQLLQIQPFTTHSFKILAGLTMKEIDLNIEGDHFKTSLYPKDLVMTQNFIHINDTIVWGQGGSDQFKFMVVNTKNAEILNKIPISNLKTVFSKEELQFAFNGNGFYHPWWKKVVWSHISINTIEFYLSDGSLNKEWGFW
jgi:hypothetical protein